MIKILYYLPFIISLILYVFLGIISSFTSINLLAWISIILLFISGYLMNKNKWNGSIIGIVIGIILIYMGTKETGQVIKETYLGIIIFLYYSLCGFISYKKGKK